LDQPNVNGLFSCYLFFSEFHCLNRHENTSECEKWTEQGECEKNPVWMGAHCRVACGMCNITCTDM